MKALVVQNIGIEGLGRVEEWLGAAGWTFDIRAMHDGDTLPDTLEGYGGLIILGGPMGAYEKDRYPYFQTVENLIREAAGWGLPALGICLGSQLIAQALGGSVFPNRVKEIGPSNVYLTDAAGEDPLFAGLGGEELAVFQWHGDTFTLPDGAVLLATSTDCQNQAFRYGERVYGLQFHVEVDEAMVASWAEAYREELFGFNGASPAELVARFQGETGLRSQADAFGKGLVRVFGQ